MVVFIYISLETDTKSSVSKPSEHTIITLQYHVTILCLVDFLDRLKLVYLLFFLAIYNLIS